MRQLFPILLALLAAASLGAQVELLGPSQKMSGRVARDLGASKRIRHVRFHSETLPALAPANPEGRLQGPASARFSLFADRSATVVFDSAKMELGDQAGVWTGTINGQPNSLAVIATTDGVTVGHFRFADGTNIEMHGATDGSAVVRELGPESRTCAVGAPGAERIDLQAPASPKSLRATSPERQQLPPDNGRTLDMLILYTPRAEVRAGGIAALQSRILVANAEANRVLRDSDIDLEFRVVRIDPLAVSESLSMRDDLGALANLPPVQAWRNQLGADIVHLIEDSPDDFCGIAYRPDPSEFASGAAQAMAFAISQVSCLRPGNVTYYHEVGHVMGLHHDPATRRSQGGPPVADPPFAQGYQQLRRAPHFRTVMAYSCPGCETSLHFANPFVSYRGIPTGVQGEYDTAAHVSLWKQAIANFRRSGAEDQLPELGEMAEPRPDSRLAPGDTLFRWRPRPNGFYSLLAGTDGPGSSNVFRSPRLGRPEATIPVPTSGSTLYVELRTWTGAEWQSRRYEYPLGAGPTGAELTATTVANCRSPTTTLRWNAPGAGQVQVRVGSPNGSPMTGWDPEVGSAASGPWVSRGLTFYLVDRAGSVLARVTPEFRCGDDPPPPPPPPVGNTTFTATEIDNCERPITTLRWYAPGRGQVQVRVGSLTGAPLTGWEPEQGSATTGPWVSPGMTFYLVDRNGVQIATVRPTMQCPRPESVEFTATPITNCIRPSTTLRWNAPRAGQVQVRVRSINGSPLTGWEAERGSTTTGPWVERGMTFYLINRAGRQLATVRPEFSCAVSPTSFAYRGIPAAAAQKMSEVRRAGHTIRKFVIAPNGGWLILWGRNGFWASGVPNDLFQWLQTYNRANRLIKDVSMGSNGTWVILLDFNAWRSFAPRSINAALNELVSQRRELSLVELTPSGGWIVVYGRNGYRSFGLPPNLLGPLSKVNAQGHRFDAIAFGSNSWVFSYGGGGYWRYNIPQTLHDAMGNLNRSGRPISDVEIGPAGEWTVISNQTRAGRFGEESGKGLRNEAPSPPQGYAAEPIGEPEPAAGPVDNSHGAGEDMMPPEISIAPPERGPDTGVGR